jgi:23S rRNA (cytosine1962-C5)-methyltransferase
MPGSLAVLEDEGRTPLGLVAVNPASKIIARMLDRDPAAVLDEDWFAARLDRALALRARLHDAPYYRLVHAEADGLPGVVIDRFGDTLVVQPNAAWAEAHLAVLTRALVAVTGAANVLKNAGGRARGLEGLDDAPGVLHGQAPEAPVPVPMNGATYLADLTGGQKTGLYFDQRPNHAFAAPLAGTGGRVLDVFAHVGGFGLVVCDPPAFAPNKQSLSNGLRAYERVARLAAPLVAPGGYLALCSCSHAADLERFRTACTRGIGRAGRSAQLIHTGFAGPDHPQLPQLAESGYLKALFSRL